MQGTSEFEDLSDISDFAISIRLVKSKITGDHFLVTAEIELRTLLVIL
jgi:hypothetical protein